MDFLQLPMITLHRYKRHYKLQLKPSTSKIQLVEVFVCVWGGGLWVCVWGVKREREGIIGE